MRSNAHAYQDSMVESGGKPNLFNKFIFLQYNVDWFAVSYNKQGFLEITFIVFQDGSAYDKIDGVDMSWMGS